MKMLFPTYFKKRAVGLIAISLFAMSEVSGASPLLYEQSPVIVPGVEALQADNPFWADDFTIGHSTLDRIIWWGANLPDNTGSADNFVIQLYSDLQGTGTVLNNGDFGSVAFDKSASILNSDVPYYQYQFTLSTPLELLAGTYYLSIQSHNQIDPWFWLNGNSGNGAVSYLDGSWQPTAGDLSFRLEGNTIQNVPEPDSSMLIIVGLGMLTILSIRLGRGSKLRA